MISCSVWKEGILGNGEGIKSLHSKKNSFITFWVGIFLYHLDLHVLIYLFNSIIIFVCKFWVHHSRNENTYSLELSRKIPILPDIGALGTQYGALLFMAAQRSRDFQPQQSSVVLIRREHWDIAKWHHTCIVIYTHIYENFYNYTP